MVAAGHNTATAYLQIQRVNLTATAHSKVATNPPVQILWADYPVKRPIAPTKTDFLAFIQANSPGDTICNSVALWQKAIYAAGRLYNVKKCFIYM